MRMPRLRLVKPASLPHAFGRAAVLLLLTVVCANVYRRLVYDTTDLYKCSELLQGRGQWLDSPERNPERRPFQNWQVPGCLLHDYTTPEIATCNEDGQVLFIGDTTVRQVFWAAARKLDNEWVFERQQELDKHEDLHLEKDGARLSFMWDPWLNSTAFQGELKAYIDRNRPQHGEKKLQPSDGKRRSVLLYIGGGLWHARHLGDEYLTNFNRLVDRVAAVMSSTHDRLTSPANIRAHGDDGVDDQIFFAPVPDPLHDRLSPSREVTISQNKIRAMNDHLQLWSNRGLNVPWAYRDMTANWPEMVGESGLHVMDRVATQMADVVLNYRCNAKAAQKHGYPFSRTCCSAYRPVNSIQMITVLLLVPFIAFSGFNCFFGSPDDRGAIVVIADALTVFCLAGVYCFVADRTHVFDKIPKEFANIDFRVIVGIAVLLCLASVQRVPAPASKSQKRSPEKIARSISFLPREQSDEFKGWMQLYVLVYAYTGASSVMDFYEVFRVFIALYLLLSGFGHATYFLRTKDYSTQRLMGVVLRLNTLPVLLALALDRPYTSYHFAPLVTCWYLVTYVTLRIGQRWNESFGLLLVKVVFAALLMNVLIHTHGILEILATVSNVMFRARIDVDALRFHLGIDKYVVFVGVIVAALRMRVRSMFRTHQKQLSLTGYIVKRYFLLHQIVTITFASVSIPVFWALTRRCRTKADYDSWSPYITWIPALSFLILRNTTESLRTRYCVWFAWLGHLSLELHLLSHHIWLAGDGEGLLKIGFRHGIGTFLGDKWRDLVILTPILVWLAWKVHEATKTTTSWLLYGQPGSSDRDVQIPNMDTMELPGWHRSDGRIEEDAENRHQDQRSELWRLLCRVGGVMVVVWVANLLSS